MSWLDRLRGGFAKTSERLADTGEIDLEAFG